MTGLARVAENVAMYKGLTHRGSAAPDGASPLKLATVAVEGRDPDQGRQYLREWLRDGADRAAPCRVQLEVEACFAPLLRWVLAWWKGTELTLAVDPTAKGEDLVVLVVSVVYRGLVLAVATLWVLAYGTRVEEARLRGLPALSLTPCRLKSLPRSIIQCSRGHASLRPQPDLQVRIGTDARHGLPNTPEHPDRTGTCTECIQKPPLSKGACGVHDRSCGLPAELWLLLISETSSHH